MASIVLRPATRQEGPVVVEVEGLVRVQGHGNCRFASR